MEASAGGDEGGVGMGSDEVGDREGWGNGRYEGGIVGDGEQTRR